MLTARVRSACKARTFSTVCESQTICLSEVAQKQPLVALPRIRRPRDDSPRVPLMARQTRGVATPPKSWQGVRVAASTR